jgi:glycosyltransferase 2 family protein
VSGQRGRLLAGVAAAFVLLAFFFRGMDWAALGGALRHANPVPLAGVVVTSVGVYCVRAWRWRQLLAPLGRVRFFDVLAATYVGFASGMLIPRAQEVVRPWLVSRRYPIPLSAGFATVVLERLIDLITVLVLFALYLFVLPVPAAQVSGAHMDAIKVAGAMAALGALVVLALLFALHTWPDAVVGGLEKLLARAPGWLAAPLGRAVRAFSEGLAVLRAPWPQQLGIAGQSLLLWLLIALGFQLNHVGFSIDLPFQATFLLIAFLVVGVSIPTPGMVGGFHAFYLLALTQVYGVDRATAAAAGIAAHALTNLPVLVIGLVLLGREGVTLGRVARVAETTDSTGSTEPHTVAMGSEIR